jgi:hypothetical protein
VDKIQISGNCCKTREPVEKCVECALARIKALNEEKQVEGEMEEGAGAN